MIRPSFTPDGISVNSYNDILNELISEYKAIYGADIIVTQDTPDGQKIGLEAIILKNLADAVVEILSQLDPDTAQGQFLNVISKYWGIVRKPASRAQVDIDIVSSVNSLLLPSGFVVSDDTGAQWQTLQDYILSSGSNTITCFSDFGNFSALANTITRIVTPIVGIASINNPTSSVAGTIEESDLELRQRWQKAQETSGQSTIGTLLYKLLQVNGVIDVKIYENLTNVFDSVLQLQGHSIWVLVKGGDIQDIVKTIAIDKTAGTGLKGSIMGTYEETYTYNSNTKIITSQIYFDRPVDKDVYMEVTVKATKGFVDTQLIKDAISKRIFSIGENVLVGTLYSTIFATSESLEVYDLRLSRDSSTWTAGILLAEPNEVLYIPESNINITVMP